MSTSNEAVCAQHGHTWLPWGPWLPNVRRFDFKTRQSAEPEPVAKWRERVCGFCAATEIDRGTVSASVPHGETMKTRAEHLAWCKQRALEYIDKGQIEEGLTSMMSDMSKHPETASPALDQLTLMLMMSGNLRSAADARRHIEGYN